jgi:hypothetical protein
MRGRPKSQLGRGLAALSSRRSALRHNGGARAPGALMVRSPRKVHACDGALTGGPVAASRWQATISEHRGNSGKTPGMLAGNNAHRKGVIDDEATRRQGATGFCTRRTLQRGERSIRVANGVKVKVKAIGELPLELNNGFILHLHNVLYVLSLSRNLISVSCLDDDGYDCQFGNR